MPPQEAIAAGRLSEAVELQQSIAESGDPAARLLLFELLTLSGRLNDAAAQLRLIDSPDAAWPATRRRFFRILKAESARRKRGRPALEEPAPLHARCRRRAIREMNCEEYESALEWIDKADERSPILRGHVDGREFEGMRDTDDRFGSVLEAFVGARYCWIPWEALSRIVLEPEVGVMDVAYRGARLRFRTGTETHVILPMTYPHSHEEFALGLDTDWSETGGVMCGIGARVIMFGDDEVILGDCRAVDIGV